MGGMLPELTREQRADALKLAVAARRERAAAKAAVASGEADPSEILLSPGGPYARMRLYEFLTSCPGIGPATARRAIAALGVGEGRRLRSLGTRQRRELADAVGAVGAGEHAATAIRRAIGAGRASRPGTEV